MTFYSMGSEESISIFARISSHNFNVLDFHRSRQETGLPIPVISILTKIWGSVLPNCKLVRMLCGLTLLNTCWRAVFSSLFGFAFVFM